MLPSAVGDLEGVSGLLAPGDHAGGLHRIDHRAVELEFPLARHRIGGEGHLGEKAPRVLQIAV